MFNRIMVPVDLAHVGQLQKSLKCASDLAKLYQIPVVYAGVSAAVPGKLAHSPAEYAALLEKFAAEQASAAGIETSAHPMVAHDPTVDLDPTLLRAAKEVDADLIVMASHVPRLTDYLWPSNGGTIAAHAKASVMVVRP